MLSYKNKNYCVHKKKLNFNKNINKINNNNTTKNLQVSILYATNPNLVFQLNNVLNP